ncbi:MAG TPA: hypothetical protein VK636_20840 [Gemmatimonadaceae bacterium]|nr:hypothetical protein [Gemmatimonadaceae bacterium]
MKIVSVSAECPYCGGGAALMSEPSEATNAEIIKRFSGMSIHCQHRGCEMTYWLRRVGLKILRTDG